MKPDFVTAYPNRRCFILMCNKRLTEAISWEMARNPSRQESSPASSKGDSAFRCRRKLIAKWPNLIYLPMYRKI